MERMRKTLVTFFTVRISSIMLPAACHRFQSSSWQCPFDRTGKLEVSNVDVFVFLPHDVRDFRNDARTVVMGDQDGVVFPIEVNGHAIDGVDTDIAAADAGPLDTTGVPLTPLTWMRAVVGMTARNLVGTKR